MAVTLFYNGVTASFKFDFMSEAELNSYRFLSGEDPSDEMLAQIMHEAAMDAKERNEKATKHSLMNLKKEERF